MRLRLGTQSFDTRYHEQSHHTNQPSASSERHDNIVIANLLAIGEAVTAAFRAEGIEVLEHTQASQVADYCRAGDLYGLRDMVKWCATDPRMAAGYADNANAQVMIVSTSE